MTLNLLYHIKTTNDAVTELELKRVTAVMHTKVFVKVKEVD